MYVYIIEYKNKKAIEYYKQFKNSKQLIKQNVHIHYISKTIYRTDTLEDACKLKSKNLAKKFLKTIRKFDYVCSSSRKFIYAIKRIDVDSSKRIIDDKEYCKLQKALTKILNT